MVCKYSELMEADDINKLLDFKCDLKQTKERGADVPLFSILHDIDLSHKVKEKNKLKYISWAVAWDVLKTNDPYASFSVWENSNGRFWFDDGRTGWVKVSVTYNGETLTEILPIMDNRNQDIPAESITSTSANKAVKRALAKACGLHGVGLYVYEGEDLPEKVKKEKEKATAEEVAKQKELQAEIKKVVKIATTKIGEGADKKEIYKLIAEHNNGNQNPNSIKEVAIAKKISEVLKKYKIQGE